MQHITQQQLDAMLNKDKSLRKALFKNNGQINYSSQGEKHWSDSKRQQTAARRAPQFSSPALRKVMNARNKSAPVRRPVQGVVPSPSSRIGSSSAEKSRAAAPTPKVLQPVVQGARVEKNPCAGFVPDLRRKKNVLAVPQRKPLASVSANVGQKGVGAERAVDKEAAKSCVLVAAPLKIEKRASTPEIRGSDSRTCPVANAPASVMQFLTYDESVEEQMTGYDSVDILFEETPAACEMAVCEKMDESEDSDEEFDRIFKGEDEEADLAAAVEEGTAAEQEGVDSCVRDGAPPLTGNRERDVQIQGQWLSGLVAMKHREGAQAAGWKFGMGPAIVAQTVQPVEEVAEEYSDCEYSDSEEQSEEESEEE